MCGANAVEKPSARLLSVSITLQTERTDRQRHSQQRAEEIVRAEREAAGEEQGGKPAFALDDRGEHEERGEYRQAVAKALEAERHECTRAQHGGSVAPLRPADCSKRRYITAQRDRDAAHEQRE